MVIRFRPDYRHPYFADVKATPAPVAQGECTAIIGTYRELMEAAESGVRIKRYVYVLHGPESQFLSESRRDSLWARFEVPVFALMLGRRGRLMGWECEVHDGLHTDSRHPDMPRLARRLETTPCDCGRPGHRLIVSQPRGLVFAASGLGHTDALRAFSAAARPSPAGV
jgi:hypothetical protein